MRARITKAAVLAAGIVMATGYFLMRSQAASLVDLEGQLDLDVGGVLTVYGGPGGAGAVYFGELDEMWPRILYHNGMGGGMGFFEFTDPVCADGFYTSSSRDLKTSITAVSEAEAWEDLDQLTPVRFQYASRPIGDDTVQMGFIAEDLPARLRREAPVVAWNAIITNNTGALREAKARILRQEAEIQALRAKVAQLETKQAEILARLDALAPTQ